MDEKLRQVYEDYLNKVDFLEKNRKPGAGLFGTKGGPADDPCHERFATDVAETLTCLEDRNPKTDEVMETLRGIYHAPKEHVNLRSAYWMLLAVHGLTFGLIELLPSENAEELLREYCKTYPRWERLPVQQQVIAKLKKRRGK